ncbi:MAG TPA: alpha/beta hydrolase [Gemmatimonadota bacterium]|nr:alpha/beta hydrolase [Gemmatimonadota bacterium]
MSRGAGARGPGPGLLRAAGRRLEVRRFGPAPGAAPPVVFLHEGLGSAGLWRDYPERLCRRLGWSGLAYSRAGYGASDPAELPRPVDFMHREAHAVLPALLEAAGIERPVLYGHSDGASIALLFAARSPGGVRALVLEAPHAFVEDVTVRSIAALGDAYRSGGLRSTLARWHDDPDATFHGWRDIWLKPAFRSWDIRDELAGVTAPTLVLQGEDDEYGTWAQVEAVEAGAIGPVRSVRLAGCGHAPHRDRPDRALGEAERFLRET